MMNQKSFVLLLTFGLLSSVPAQIFGEAQGVPQPIQEVFQSNLVYPQEEDEIQFTFFPSYRKNRNSEKVRTLVEIEYGITDAFQVIAEWDALLFQNLELGPTLSGPGNLELGGQYSWMGLVDGNTHFSLGTLVELPTGSMNDGLTDGLLEWKPFAVLARDFPQWNQSQVFIEFGYSTVNRIRTIPENSESGLEFDSLMLNVGGFFPVGPWRGVLEVNSSNNQWDGGDKNEIFLTPGVIYKFLNGLELGVGTSIGLTDSSDDFRVIGYLMWEFEFGE